MTIPTKPDGTTIPDEPLFRRMVDNATERPSHVVISDKSVGVEADSMRIFADLLHMRNVIRQHEASADAYISILMPINYEFVITILAVLASGQAFAPIRFGCTAEYAISLMRRSGSTCMVYGALETNFAIEMEQLASAQGFPIQIVPFAGSTEPLPLHIGDLNVRLDTEKPTDPDRPGMLVYSSGTAGEKPKGIMHNRRFLDRPGNLPPQTVFLMVADPIQAISSFNILTIPLSTGCQLRFISRADGVAEIWEQFRNNRIISFTTIPDTWNEMAWYYRNRIQQLPQEARDSYLEGARRIMFPCTQGASTPASVLRFWKEDLQRPIYNVFGATELGGLALCTGPDTVSDDYQCIGKPKPGITAKLSDGDHGELLVKSPNVMSGYLDDPERTKSVFDEEGFYRTGDLVHLSAQGEYIYEKRINKPPKNPVLFMENTLSTLPYLHNTLVAQLPFDHAYGSSMLGLVVCIRPPPLSSSSKTKTKASMAEYMADCMYRLRAALSLTFLQLDTMVPLAVCVLGPGEEMKWEKGDLRDVFPYHVDPGFRADFEIGMHRAWMN